MSNNDTLFGWMSGTPPPTAVPAIGSNPYPPTMEDPIFGAKGRPGLWGLPGEVLKGLGINPSWKDFFPNIDGGDYEHYKGPDTTTPLNLPKPTDSGFYLGRNTNTGYTGSFSRPKTKWDGFNINMGNWKPPQSWDNRPDNSKALVVYDSAYNKKGRYLFNKHAKRVSKRRKYKRIYK